ncbi:MAG: hypothetical protein L3J69_14345, partial [Desulfobacula sp.]|nr:hypothetical protein [Desulfobacula sp.]
MRNFIWFVVLFCLLNPVSLSFGESHDFCDEFAKAAILQYKEAKALGMNTPFPVWSDNYNHHYSWCRTQSMQPVEQGHALRQAQIEEYKKNNIKAVPMKKGLATPEVISSGYKIIPSKLAKASIQVYQISVASGKKYLTAVQVRAGNKVFIDRNFNYANIPVDLIKGVGILTSNNDKFSTGDRAFLSFTIDRPGIVYVAYDRRYKTLPAWLRSFQKMRKSLVYNVSGGNVVGDLYQKHFPKGRVVLGGNLSVGSRENLSMYTVFVVAAKGSIANAGRKTPRTALINQVRDKKNKFDVMMTKELSNYNQRIDQAIRNNVARQKKINTQVFKTLLSPDQIAAYLLASTPNDGKPYSLNLKDFEALPRKKGESIRLQRKKKSNASIAVMQQRPKGLLAPLKPMNLSKIPVDGLAQIVSFPGTDALEPGDWVYISGIGFGNSPGTILLEYTVNSDEFGKEWIKHALVVSPGTHHLVWRDNIIVFRLPDTLPNINSIDLGKGQGIGKAALTLKLNTGKKIIRQVKLEVDKIKLIDIWTSSSIDVTYYMPKADDHWEKFRNSYTKDEFYTRMPDKMASNNIGMEYRSIEPGSEVIINGSGFLDTPGQVEIMVGNKKVPIIPLGNDWWSNYAIRFKVGNIPGHVSRDIGILTIRTSS